MRWLFLVLLLTTATGCTGFLPALQAAGQAAQWVGTILDVAEGGADAYLDRHPSQDVEREVSAALRRARLALAAHNAALAAGEAATAADVEATSAEVLRAYGALRALLADTGILTGTSPAGGAEGDAPEPLPVELPTEAAVAERL